MAEVLAEFTDVIVSDDKTRYHARACGAAMPDGLWEGWIEFIPIDGSQPVRSGRETTQPNRDDIIYWATGLTNVYAEGALRRALTPAAPRRAVEAARPVFDGPAPARPAPADVADVREAVLDPFSVYLKGEPLLRKELSALSAWHLVNIILAYELSDEPIAALNRMPAVTLIELIASAVRGRSLARK
jgi:hypothetical protein